MARKIDEKRAKRALLQWRKAGGSASAFAKRAGMSATTLLRWRERFWDDLEDEPKFARVVVRQGAGPRGTRARDERADEYVVEALGGRRIHVRAGFDGDEVGRLLEIVEGAGC